MADFSRICVCGRDDIGLHTIGVCQALKMALGPDENDEDDDDGERYA